MLTSFASNIGPILGAVVGTGTNKILDVGCGPGKYGLLIREAIASVRSEAGELSPDLSNLKIDAIESGDYFFKNYPLEEIYGIIYKKDLFEIDPFIYNQYQLMLLIDVIEHHSKEKIHEFFSKINTRVLISTPKQTVMYTHRHYDIDVHVSQWGPEDFKQYNVVDYSTPDSWIYIIN
jgi:2-polyprenyl-3-methyl-5-hydroxy-6-metoxy-1,4-benzoquinol methylase